MKTFNVSCEVGGQRGTFRVHVGQPAPGLAPLKYQAAWLWEVSRGVIDPAVLEVFNQLFALAREQRLSFEDLCTETLTGRKTKGLSRNNLGN